MTGLGLNISAGIGFEEKVSAGPERSQIYPKSRGRQKVASDSASFPLCPTHLASRPFDL